MVSANSRADRSVCGYTATDGFCEGLLPAPMREVLQLAREARPQQRLHCVAFHSEENGHEIARMGASFAAGLHPKDVMVLSVWVTETAADEVRSVSHILILRVEVAR